MSECKHGLKEGCTYCHVRAAAPRPATVAPPAAKRRTTRTSRMSENMNERMTALKKRLRELRGE